jgi:hypothetical protein
MSKLSFADESIQTLSHATAIIGEGEQAQNDLIQALHISPHDTVTLDALEAGGIKEVRAFASLLLLSPQFGSVRLGIIKQAHLLTPEAQNALLKLLEEPPERVRIILFIARESAMLATVLSRCRRYYTSAQTTGEGALFATKDPIEQFNQAESLAKDDALVERVGHYLASVYVAWCSAGRPDSGLDELTRIWYFYEQLHGQVNKRLALEYEVLSSLEPGV